MKISKNALTVLEKRYFIKDEDGKPIEDLEGMFHRVAGAIAKADKSFNRKADVSKTEQRFYEMMTNLDSVSYTHLDVYKRQVFPHFQHKSKRRDK